MVRADEQKCTGCGSCVNICHESCLSLLNEQVVIDYKFCSTCTQCIAICPQIALRWEDARAIPFDNSRLPSAVQLDELFKQRRTIRHFQEKKPERQLIEEIINYGVYAPSHNFSFRAIAVDDKNLLNQMDQVVFCYNQKIYKYLYKPAMIRFFVEKLSLSRKDEYLKAKPKLEKSLRFGRGYQNIPPVIIFIVGDRRVPLSMESAQYALYNIDLYARTRGLGCRNLVGNQMFLNRSKAFRHLLKMEQHEKIFATMGMGYPAKKFRNKVIGKQMRIQWNAE
jgi:nitroreductase/NAD-dependent dihydropyrimidine dehydrogenase PreA subunit